MGAVESTSYPSCAPQTTYNEAEVEPGLNHATMAAAVISNEWILYTGLLPVLTWRGEISLVAPKSIYITAGLGIKKISFSFSVHHSSYNTRLLSTKGESAISPMQ
jgi:hypothetical protein